MGRGMRRRRRRRVMVGGALLVGGVHAMKKLTTKDAQAIEQATGKPPEELSEEELDQAMAQLNITGEPVTPEDEQAMAAAEAADPDDGE
jgi:hypothetical protein